LSRYENVLVDIDDNFKLSDKPSPPQRLNVEEVTPESVALSWKEPEDIGGCDITGYIIERRDANRQSWNKVATVKKLEHVVTKLVEGNSYVFRVSAENEVGVSAPVETAPVKAKYGFGKDKFSI
jgi:titin